MKDQPDQLSDEAKAIMDRLKSARTVNTRAAEIIARARGALQELRALTTPEQLPGRFPSRALVHDASKRLLHGLVSLERQINPE